MPVSISVVNTSSLNEATRNGTQPNWTTLNTERMLAEVSAREVRSLYPVIIFYASILVIGVFGNALVLMVYTFRYKRSPARVYILFLASIDFSICLFGLPYHLMDLTHPYTFRNALLCKSLTFIVTTLFYMSIFGLIVIAVDRYLKICKPLGRIQLSYFGRKWACAAAFGLALLLSWPNLLLYGRSEMEMDGVIGYACFIETAYLETTYPFVYVMSTLIVCTGSTVFLVAAYARICHQIYTRYQGVRFAVKFNKYAMDDISGTDEISVKSIDIAPHTEVHTPPESRNLLLAGDDTNWNSNSADDADSRMLPFGPDTPTDSSQSLDTGHELQDTVKPDSHLRPENQFPLIIGSNITVSSIQSQHNELADFIQATNHSHSTSTDESLCNLYLKSYSSLVSNHIQTNQNTGCESDVRASSADRMPIKHNNGRAAYASDEKARETYTGSGQNVSASSQQPDPCLPLCIHKPIRALQSRAKNRLSLPSHVNAHRFKNRDLCRSNSERFRNSVIPDKLLFYASDQHFLPKSKSPSVEFKSNDVLRVHSGSIADGMTVKGAKLSRKYSKITKIMLTITTVFVLSYVPALVITILCIVKPELWDLISVNETVWFEFLLRFYLVNNICNPFIYGFWDSRFKKEVLLTLSTIFKLCKVTQQRTSNGVSSSWA